MKERIAAILLPLYDSAVHGNVQMQDDDYVAFMHHSIIGTGKFSFPSNEHAYNQAQPFPRGPHICTQ